MEVTFSDGGFCLGTGDGMLYKQAENGGWKRFIGIIGTGAIKSFTGSGHSVDEKLFIICNNDLYEFSPESTLGPKKVFIADTLNAEDEEADLEDADTETEGIFLLREIRSKNKNAYLATSRGIFVSGDSGKTWKRFNESGLGTLEINDILITSKDDLFAATERCVFRYDRKEEIWLSLYSGTTGIKARKVIESGDGRIIAISKDRIYVLGPSYAPNPEQVLFSLKNEPTIKEVQDVAIRYAEVHPDKIKKWRQKARIKAILPKLSIGIDNSSSDTYEIYTSTTTSYWMYGPRDNTEGWDANLSWDLSELIWNPDQTNIDVRSKLMVQLRVSYVLI